MPEYVVPLEVMARWEPNDPRAVLVVAGGRAALAVEPHVDDADRRAVVLVWDGVHSATMSDPGEETLGGHRLFYRGLTDVRWIGVVRDSALVESLAAIDRGHARQDRAAFERLVHHVALLTDATVEVVAGLLRVERWAGPTVAAAVTALG